VPAVDRHRWEPTAELGDLGRLQRWKLRPDLVRELAQRFEVERQVFDVEVRAQRAYVYLKRVRFVTAEQQSATLGPHVHVDIEHADDRLVGADTRDGSGDVQLMPGGHDRDADACHLRDNPRPGARGVDDDGGADLTLVGQHTLDRAIARADRRDWRVRQDRRAQSLGGADVRARQVDWLEVQVGRVVPGSQGSVGVQEGSQSLGLARRHVVDVDAHRLAFFDLIVYLRNELWCAG